MTKPLTDTQIRSLKLPASGQTDVIDVRSPGLFLRLSRYAKTWTFRFTDPVSGKRDRMTLAKYPDLSLGDARDRAEELRKAVAQGINPKEAKRTERSDAPTRTFTALSDRYLKEHARRFKKSADADERNLRLHILPKWGNRSYRSITRADIIELIEGLIADDKPTLANRVQSLISKMYSFATDAALIDTNPAVRLKKRGKETALTRTLDDAEVRLFWSSITSPPVSEPVGVALKLALLTGLRAGEVSGLHKTEIINLDDAEQAAILIAGERVKNGRTHLVPLAPMARQLVLDAIKLARDSTDYLFPLRFKDDLPLDPHTLARAMRCFADDLDAGDAAPGIQTLKAEPPTPHDLRRTFATRLSALGVPKEDRDACMNHVPTDVGSKHYDLYDRQEEKRRALNLWAAALANILEGKKHAANVVAMRRRS
ncbi:MAG: integrase arm-type DNA-binding domain-containing protein [Bradyrhizobium sp.]|uniref:tyrosine-type recombinase/integrase n=1 Tax=Bradyrhizobium sp. TaxID=376 RepID=UPI003C7AF79D